MVKKYSIYIIKCFPRSVIGYCGQTLLLQKACHSGESSPPTTTECQNELESQKTVIQIQTWMHSIIFLVPLIFVMFAGPWSDNHGKWRKPLLYFPLFGQTVANFLCILNVYFWSWSPVATALSGSILPAVTGSLSCFMMGAHSYISDITMEKARTTRLGICVGILLIGNPMGAFLFGLLFYKIGFYGVFILGSLLNTTAVLYLFLFVDESKPGEKVFKLKTLQSLVGPKHIIQSYKTVFKPREGYRRAILLLLVAVSPITRTSLQGESSLLYLFLRVKFHWNEVDYAFYAGYKSVVIFIGLLISLCLFSRRLAISDAVLGMMASVTLMVASIAYTFSSMPWEYYVCPLVDFMHGAGMTVVFSIVSKTIESGELGLVNSILGVVDVVVPRVSVALYNQVYNYTFAQMPGAFFLLSFACGAIALVIFGVVNVFLRMQRSHKSENYISSF